MATNRKKFSQYVRWPFLTRVSGGHDKSVYLDRVALTPYTRRGQLLLHVFYRGDADQDPHDHPFDFWTFPLVSYVETVLGSDGTTRNSIVPAFRWNFRPAEHCHRVLHPLDYRRRIILTLVWRKPRRRHWGFWEVDTGQRDVRLPRANGRVFVPWRVYLDLEPLPEKSPDLWQYEQRGAFLCAWHPEVGWVGNVNSRSSERRSYRPAQLAWAEFERRGREQAS